MKRLALTQTSVPVNVNLSRFAGESGVEELHMSFVPTGSAPFQTQLTWIETAWRNAIQELGLPARTCVYRRFFCSDLPNQRKWLDENSFSNGIPAAETSCATSWVSQPPGSCARVALWTYHIHDPNAALDKTEEGSHLMLRRNGLTHVWTTGMLAPMVEGSYGQTGAILNDYKTFLEQNGMRLDLNLVRTWFTVQDIDANYQGLVKARREFFAANGLTADTHFVASTGVGGGHSDVRAHVGMDAYAVAGIRPEQIKFLCAPEHLSPTNIYGVTFERGTAVAYRDRRHVFISGTASIDRDGNIVHAGDVLKQLDRTVENMEALLAKADATLADMAQIIVYVRDPADHAEVTQGVRERFGETPMVSVLSNVCRPGWLVEIEGIAIVPASNTQLATF